ncbi:PepSY domain-containing protein [Massilia sp. Leaf139]|uniref:PepSY-associated TM helix domain-containing protein n=1 Tax=Massilia sp. Leaf139 TaxID=1736272 RepID=UPI0006F7EDF2|nr:PepSY domain-containing protein [Massilia sp. Leaf139]KQQ93665.1 hypothetical protein ASF77_22545 [Massilia sp. Leaf139]
MNDSLSTERALSALAARRRSLYLRVHCWAALIATPFLLLATLTGLLYVFVPQIEARLYEGLDRVAPRGVMLPLDRSVAAAQGAVPHGLALRSVLPPFAPGDSVKVLFEPARGHEAAGHHHGAPPASAQAARPLTVFVDPYSGRVLGVQNTGERFSDWSKSLHSRLLQGDGWRWMIELGASWLLVMLLTGVYLWWPQPGGSGLPRAGKTGRAAWRQWHAFAGVALGLLSLVMVVTGITWSQYAGEQVRRLRDAAGQASPRAPSHLHSRPAPGTRQLDWEGAWAHARGIAPPIAMSLSPPRGADGVWRAAGADRTQPTRRFDLAFDAYDGRVLYRAGWEDQTAFGKATAVGIPFHRGEFGLWNQALLFLFGLGVLFSLVSGWVMFYKRKRSGRLGLPALLPGALRAASPLAWLGALALCALMPLLAVSAAVVLMLEWLVLQRARPA